MQIYILCRLRKLSTIRSIQRFKSSSAFKGYMKTSKDPSLADEPIHLEISGLDPEQRVTLHSSVRLSDSSILECLAHYVSDMKGSISLDHQESLGGDYTGVEPMGLFSFLMPSPLNKRKYVRLLIKDPTKPFQVDLRILNDFIPSLEDASAENRFKEEPHLTVNRSFMAPGVKEIPVWDGNVRGTLYIPPGKGPFPGVISISGGYPGAVKYKAALLANHGFAAIALKYFGEDDLPGVFFNVELEYIEEAAKFLINHPSVDGGNGVGFVSSCYGGAIALAASSVLPQGLIRCVTAINAFPFKLGTMTYKGKPILPGKCMSMSSHQQPKSEPLVTYGHMSLVRDFNLIIASNMSYDGIRTWNFVLPVDTELPANSKCMNIFDRHDISYLFVSGEEDPFLPTTLLSTVTQKFFEDSKHPDHNFLHYKGAGHFLEHRFYPLVEASWVIMEVQVGGGMQPYHDMAQSDSWPKIIDFVRKRLCAPTP